MRKIAIIGSGTSGMFAAHALLQKGYDVTVYSDRTADDWLNKSAPTGTAYLYECNIMLEREIGIDHWYDGSFQGDGVHLDFQPSRGDERLIVTGDFEGHGAAIDIRTRVARWMNDFEDQGGTLDIGTVTVEQLDKIATANDLTLLAAGKGDVSAVIPRDPERSVYDKPQRLLCMGIVEGVEHPAAGRVDMNAVQFNFFGDAGEYFWVPYTHKEAGATWCWLMEAKPGGYLDKFGSVTNPEEATAAMKEVIKESAPYEYDNIKDMTPVEGDPYAWLKGAFPPTVRQASGRTPSGGLVIPVGDSAILFDPVGGQGGNCAQRNSMFISQAIIDRADREFDESWANRVRDDFWDYHGEAAYAFNNILLEPLTEAGRMVLGFAAENREFANQHFIGNFNKPKNFFPWMEDAALAEAKISEFQKQQVSSG